MDDQIERAAEGAADETVVEAARRRLEAALLRERVGSWLDRLELRLNRIRSRDQAIDDDLELSARLHFNNPSEQQAIQDVYQADTEIALAELGEISLENRTERCDRSIEADAAHRLEEAYLTYLARIQEIRRWTEDLSSEGLLDELSTAETLLEAETELLTSRPEPALLTPEPAFRLPDPTADERPLVQDERVIRALIREHNPSYQERAAASSRYLALAQREQSRRHVHLDFLELGYEPLGEQGFDAFGAQISVNLPLFGTTSEGYYRQLGDAALLEGSALEEELVRMAAIALADINSFRRDASAWSALLAQAIQADQIVDSWLAQRRGEPRDLLRLSRRAFGARQAVIERQLSAGLSACTLLSASGVPLSEWPGI
ncbi:MAG: hypothetical protein JW797_03025 [Bradymonadales bacterium]|nr:hypothetical protein [Bradymonadales bacterium]